MRIADGVIILGEGQFKGYPTKDVFDVFSAEPPSELADAEHMEYREGQSLKVVEAYAAIARASRDVNIQAQALQAQARCLAAAGQKQKAIDLLTGPLMDTRFRDAADQFGRLIAPPCQLFAIQLIGDPNSPAARKIAASLVDRLNDYGDIALHSAQRRFLMIELQRALPEEPSFATLKAEELASAYFETPQPPVEKNIIVKTATGGVFQMASANGKAILLFQQDELIRQLTAVGQLDKPLADANVRLTVPGWGAEGHSPFLSMTASRHMPGWTFDVFLTGQDPFAGASGRRRIMYLWTGLVGVLIITSMAAAVTIYVGRQIRLTRLKNDLIATVSHELKTPLSSMRVLVDTLLEGRCRDEGQAKEYFKLLAAENRRLTALIDNFLNFSRMERNKKAFEFNRLRMEDIVKPALEAIGDRFNSPNCRLELGMEENLPAFNGDRDALVTVVLNLLDNAYKYTGQDKCVLLRTFALNGNVYLVVTDNGIGMTRRQIARVFERFYQTDQSLSRRTGGCGLGLSIVKFIVDAHGGQIKVASQPGKGSTFTVILPAIAAGKNDQEKGIDDGR